MAKVLLFIPMYNCKNQILRVLSKLNMCKMDNDLEILIIDNVSSDLGEKEVIDYLKNNCFKNRIKVIQNKFNYGLGGSHKVAFEYAINNDFKYVTVFHGDDQADINDLENCLSSKEYVNYDCMLGARFEKGSNLDGYSKFRIFGNKVFNLIFSFCMHKKVYDLGSGFNVYSTEILKNKYYFKYKDNLTFNCYMLLATSLYNQNIKFFSINWHETDQVSNVKMIRQSLDTLKLAVDYLFRKEKFLLKEHRQALYDSYEYTVLYDSKGE